MDLEVIQNELRDLIATDSALKAWCQATYSKDHKVFVGVDTTEEGEGNYPNLPGVDDAPYVAILVNGKKAGLSDKIKRHTALITVGVADDSMVEGGEANVFEYAGEGRSKAMHRLVKDILVAKLAGDWAHLTLARMDVDTDSIEFPLFEVLCTLNLEETTPLGRGAAAFLE